MSSLQTPADAERLRRARADATPHRMLREFASLVEAISVDHPLVLVLEDLHWSDQATVDLVSVLAQRPERARDARGHVSPGGGGGARPSRALVDALQTRRIGGAILDVFATEPLPTQHPLWRLPNVATTPHIPGPSNPEGLTPVFARASTDERGLSEQSRKPDPFLNWGGSSPCVGHPPQPSLGHHLRRRRSHRG